MRNCLPKRVDQECNADTEDESIHGARTMFNGKAFMPRVSHSSQNSRLTAAPGRVENKEAGQVRIA
jgi:hypothetical protein